MSIFDFESFANGYIDAILWCDAWPASANPEHPEHSDSWESGGLEGETVTDAVRAEVIEKGQLRDFAEANAALLEAYCELRDREEDPSSFAGHDFYLTRAGHGAGFWDRGLGDLGDALAQASKDAGSVDDHMLWQNLDGTISCS